MDAEDGEAAEGVAAEEVLPELPVPAEAPPKSAAEEDVQDSEEALNIPGSLEEFATIARTAEEVAEVRHNMERLQAELRARLPDPGPSTFSAAEPLSPSSAEVMSLERAREILTSRARGGGGSATFLTATPESALPEQRAVELRTAKADVPVSAGRSCDG
eukprot:TRINITY_DN10405_c0_g1_i2.p1 TRINITY_DN10405_c0_g1~~TRINITY_DN10405_c0_g1_i2.p1  ORF type:complete len:175 (+),score=44.55 TRINITY_DN10405_c0_g1_i2:47-526(+)